MKKVTLILMFVIGVGIITNAQDVITLKNGTDINALMQKVGDIDLKDKRQSTTNCVKNTAFGLDIGLGGSIETIYNQNFPTPYFASALGIRSMLHFNPYFGIDFFKINWITDVLTSEPGKDWLMRLQIMPGIRGNSPAFFKCMSVYSTFRLGYGMSFVPKQYGVHLASHFKGLCLETELGFNLTLTVFAGFAYNYHKYFGLDAKRALHTLSFRLGFNLGKTQEAMRTEKAKFVAKFTNAERTSPQESTKLEKAKFVAELTNAKKSKVDNDLENMSFKVLDLLKYDGYSINVNKIVDLKQRESDSHKEYFIREVEYIIICFSADTNVLDIGVYLEHLDGIMANTYPTDRGEIAMISFESKSKQEMRVVAENLSSRTPDSESKFRIIIASKAKKASQRELNSLFGNDLTNKAWAETLDKLRDNGYSIYAEQIVYLKQSESGSLTESFALGNEYIIICLPDDNNVVDVGIRLERMDRRLVTSTIRGTIAKTSFKPKITQELKIVATNFSSRTPKSASKCRIIIAIKE